VGFFGGYVFDGSTWRGFDPDSGQWPDIAALWLSVYVHDSDIATVRYEPGGPGSGIAYLGRTPRVYFGDESASAPAGVLREAEGLAFWLARQQGRSDEAELRDLIASFLADDTQSSNSMITPAPEPIPAISTTPASSSKSRCPGFSRR